MFLVEIAADTNLREEKIMNIHKFCSPELVRNIINILF